jgi:flagellar FliL protein
MSDEPEVAPVKAGGTSKLVMGILVLNLLGVGGLAAFLVLGQKAGTAHAAEREPGAADAEEHASVGPILPFEPLVVNLRGTAHDPESARYLKITVQLEVKDEEARVEVEKSLVPMRSRLLGMFTALTLEDVTRAGAVQQLQDRCKELVNEVLGSRRVAHVYFTEFVVQ